MKLKRNQKGIKWNTKLCCCEAYVKEQSKLELNLNGTKKVSYGKKICCYEASVHERSKLKLNSKSIYLMFEFKDWMIDNLIINKLILSGIDQILETLIHYCIVHDQKIVIIINKCK